MSVKNVCQCISIFSTPEAFISCQVVVILPEKCMYP